MYKELATFALHVARQKQIWKDGELWTAVFISAATAVWFNADPVVMTKLRHHFGDILTVTSIIFGFVLTALTFYIDSAGSWSRDAKVRSVGQKLVDWHTWSILCILALLGYVIALWAVSDIIESQIVSVIAYSFLVFLALYSGFQIVNHTLTIWWVFQARDKLEGKSSPKLPETSRPHSHNSGRDEP